MGSRGEGRRRACASGLGGGGRRGEEAEEEEDGDNQGLVKDRRTSEKIGEAAAEREFMESHAVSQRHYMGEKFDQPYLCSHVVLGVEKTKRRNHISTHLERARISFYSRCCD